jgi:4-carboxymuconolactone decarboxylase
LTGKNEPRLEPLPVEAWSDEVVAALRAAFPDRVVDTFLDRDAESPPLPTSIATFMHHPKLTGPFLIFNNVLLRDPALSPRQRELMVLRVAWRTQSEYEWVQHVRLAERYSITRDDIDAVAADTVAENWTPLERDLVAAADQLFDGYRVDDDTWTRLAEQLDERQLVEIPFVVGAYTCVAMAFKSFGVQLEANVDPAIAPPLKD